jgi:Icc-related predicted phosphoesterase
MIALVIADDELLVAKTPAVPADVLVSCGDLPDELILEIAARTGCRQVLAVKGNHDRSGPFEAGIIDLHLATHTVKGITFGGFRGCWKYKPVGNFLYDQAEVAEQLAGFPRVDVFVAHNAPRLIHDRDDNVHPGFTAFSRYIDDAKPRYFLHGHQHRNAETTMGLTKVVGVSGHRYLAIK